MESADRDIARFRSTYSSDVEIDDRGRLVYARDIQEGELIAIPLHMLGKALKREPTAR